MTTRDDHAAFVEALDVSVEYQVGRRRLLAVDHVSLSLERGRTFGLIGESGSGKSTLARYMMGLVAGEGTVRVGDEVRESHPKQRRVSPSRLPVQIVVQDPHSALDPRLTVVTSVSEPLRAKGVSKSERMERSFAMLERVGLAAHLARRYPHQLSGGQKQRVNIARALVSDPEVLICDESVSALDVALQAEILNLLTDLQRDFGLTMFFISHDLSVIAHLADKIGVMYLGQVVELGDANDLLSAPNHPYTEALIAARPEPVPKIARSRTRIILEGEIPSPMNPPSGCRFRTRCRYAQDRCAQERPVLRTVGPDARVACHFAEEIDLRGALGEKYSLSALVPRVNDTTTGGTP